MQEPRSDPPETKNLTLFHLNIQSIRTSFNELEIFLSENPVNIFSINEHWLTTSELSMYTPKGYHIGASYCRSENNSLGYGGSLLLVRDDTPFKIFDVANFTVDVDFEACAVKLLQLNLVIISVYTARTDNVNFVLKLEFLLEFLVNNQCNFFILSDMNLDIRKNKPIVHTFIDNLRTYNTYCLFSQNTRNNSCIDNVMTNYDYCVIDKGVTKTCMSDHDILWVKLDDFSSNKSDTSETKHTFRLLSPTNINSLRDRLSIETWDDVYSLNLGVDEMCNSFVNKLLFHFNETCPLKSRIGKNNKPKRKCTKWFTQELSKLRDYVITLRDRASISHGYRELYIKTRSSYRKGIKLAKIKYNEDLIMNSNNKCKAAWSVIKNEICNNSKHRPLPKLSPDLLNNYFLNCTQSDNGNTDLTNNTLTARDLMISTNNNDSQINFKFSNILPLDLVDIVRKFNNSKSEDYLGFSNHVIKCMIDVIAHPLSYVINSMLSYSVFPKILKISKTIPLHKKKMMTKIIQPTTDQYHLSLC